MWKAPLEMPALRRWILQLYPEGESEVGLIIVKIRLFQ